MFRKLASAILCAGVLGSTQAHALGLGELTLRSALNEPLDAEIKLLSVGDLTESQVLVTLGTQEDFSRAGVDRDYFLTNMKFSVELDGKGNGVIRVKTHNLVNEPYLNFIIEARWPAGKLLREYTALLDLPIYSERAAADVNLGSTSGRGGSVISRAAPPSEPLDHSSVPASMAYAGGETYEVQRSDTLWKIAQQMRPEGDASLQQTMLAIHNLNPDAFINGDINRVKAGAVLRLPSGVQVQTAGDSSAPRSAVRQRTEGGVDTADTLPVEREATSQSDARLTLSSAGAGAGEGGGNAAEVASLKGKLNESLENLDRAERDNTDLKSRMTAMQEQVDKLQRLVQLKDEQLAALQGQVGKKASDAEPAAVAAEPASVTPAPEATVAPAAVAPTEPATAPSAETPAAEQAATSAETTTAPVATTEAGPAAGEAQPQAEAPVAQAEPPKPKPTPVAKPKPVTPAAQPGLLEMILGNPVYLGGLAGIVALLVAGLVLRQRAAQRAAEESLANDNFDTSAFDQSFDQEPQESFDEHQQAEQEHDADAEITQEMPAQTTRSETGDAIGEADIYVAYGRYQHAIDLLKNAIASEPNRSDLRVKLLEVYLEAGDRDGFRAQFASLQTLGDADATGRAKEMLMSVDDGSEWIGDSVAAFDGDATMPTAFKPSEAADLDADNTMERPAISDDDLDTLDLGDDFEEADSSSSWATSDDLEELPSTFEAEEQATSLDELDLDLGLDEETTSLAGSAAGDDEGIELEHEMMLDNDDEGELDLLESDESLAADLAESDEELDLMSDTDFELATDEAVSEAAAPADELDELELEGELETEVADKGFSKNVDDIDADIGAFDAESLQAASELNLGDDEEFDFLNDSDEVATKLDLARAYIDMGDIDGAKDILNEVLQEGEVAQKDEANKLLARIA